MTKIASSKTIAGMPYSSDTVFVDGARLASIRKKTATQFDFADEAGISTQTLSDLENDKIYVVSATFERIRDALGDLGATEADLRQLQRSATSAAEWLLERAEQIADGENIWLMRKTWPAGRQARWVRDVWWAAELLGQVERTDAQARRLLVANWDEVRCLYKWIWDKGLFEESKVLREHLISLLRRVNEPIGLAAWLHEHAVATHHRGLIHESHDACVEAIRFLESNDEDRGQKWQKIRGHLYHRLARIAQDQGRTQDALTHFRKSLKIKRRCETPTEIASTRSAAAALQESEGRLSTAAAIQAECLADCASDPHVEIDIQITCKYRLARVHRRRGREDHQRAYEIINEVLADLARHPELPRLRLCANVEAGMIALLQPQANEADAMKYARGAEGIAKGLVDHAADFADAANDLLFLSYWRAMKGVDKDSKTLRRETRWMADLVVGMGNLMSACWAHLVLALLKEDEGRARSHFFIAGSLCELLAERGCGRFDLPYLQAFSAFGFGDHGRAERLYKKANAACRAMGIRHQMEVVWDDLRSRG